MFNAIVAIDEKNGIGANGKIPWREPEDLKLFSSLTKGNVVIMGHETHKSIGYFLPDRVNIVMSRTPCPSQFEYFVQDVKSLLELLEQLNIDHENVWVIGGAQIYKLLGPLIGKYYVSHIKGNFECTTHMPDNYLADFEHLQTTKYTSFDQDIFVRRRETTDQVYYDLMQDIMDNGILMSKELDRTNTGYKMVAGRTIRFDIRNTIPLMTGRRTMWRGIVEELLWFLRGDTYSKNLESKGINIWKGNTTSDFLRKNRLPYPEGYAGPIYGYQWRSWGKPYMHVTHSTTVILFVLGCLFLNIAISGPWKGLSCILFMLMFFVCPTEFRKTGIDQLQEVINGLRNPITRYSRRHIISSWNVEQLPQMALPPCHVLYQFIVDANDEIHTVFYQRSSDVFLACSWNVTSAAILTYIIAQQTGLKPATVTMQIGNAHLYRNHFTQVEELLKRPTRGFPSLVLENRPLDEYTLADFKLERYYPSPEIRAIMNI